MQKAAALLVLPIFSTLLAQAPASAPQVSVAAGVAPAAPVRSPEVHADGTVTLRFKAENAKQVNVAIDGVGRPSGMQRGANGVWEYTTAAMPPEYYGYTFQVDGTRALDPQNPVIRPNLVAASSVMHVTGATPKPWDLQDIPHGTVAHHWYVSKLGKQSGDDGERDLYVYLPPGYDAKRATKYPVLYLNHGYTDGADGWVGAGQANLILDSLIHDGKAVPMIVVMPLGYGNKSILATGFARAGGLLASNTAVFEDQLLKEVLPMVEAQYNVARDPGHRAIAGLSMGGGHSLTIGLKHPEVFQWVGAFSSAITVGGGAARAAGTPPPPPDPAADAAAFGAMVSGGATVKPIKLLWMSCGTEDNLIGVNRRFGTWAKSNIKGSVVTRDTPGMHT